MLWLLIGSVGLPVLTASIAFAHAKRKEYQALRETVQEMRLAERWEDFQ